MAEKPVQAVFAINPLGPRARARVDANDSRDVCGTHATSITHSMSLTTRQDRLHTLIMHTSTKKDRLTTARQILDIHTVNGMQIRAS